MKQDDRAKQFLPFSALKGYEELIEEPTAALPHKKEACPIKPPREIANCKAAEKAKISKKPLEK